jgi:hypothetical protein
MEAYTLITTKSDDKDKFIKVLQHIAKLYGIYLRKSDPTLSHSLVTLSNSILDSRKLFNLFRAVKEVNDFYKLFIKNNKILTSTLVDVVLQISKVFYFLFDNVAVLCKFNVMKLNYTYCSKVGSSFYLTVLICGLCKDLYRLYTLLERKEKEKKRISKETNESKGKDLNVDIVITFAVITGKIGDLLATLNASGVSKVLFGKQLHESLVVVGGLWGALVNVIEVMFKSNNGSKNK